MKNGKIKFVRMYKMYRENWYEVIYNSGRIHTYAGEESLPSTVKEYVLTATNRKEQYDNLFHRLEMIYEA